MTKVYWTLYDEATGAIQSTGHAPAGHVPPEGPIGMGMAILHRRSDPDMQRVSKGRLVLRPKRERDAVADLDWRTAVNRERDRRIEAGMTFDGVRYQTDRASRDRIAKAARRESGRESSIDWIAADNRRVQMDWQTFAAFADAVEDHERDHILAARALKDIAPADRPADPTDDAHWP